MSIIFNLVLFLGIISILLIICNNLVKEEKKIIKNVYKEKVKIEPKHVFSPIFDYEKINYETVPENKKVFILEEKFNKALLLRELEQYFNKYRKQIKIIKNIDNIPFEKNFSLSGLNLAFLGYWVKKKIKLNENIYLWPDGIFFKRFFNNKFINKIPGRKIVSDLKIPNNIKKIYVAGNLSDVSGLDIEIDWPTDPNYSIEFSDYSFEEVAESIRMDLGNFRDK
jgi:hypothetical protein